MGARHTVNSLHARLTVVEATTDKLKDVDFVALSNIDFKGISDFSEMAAQVRKLYSSAKRYGPWAFAAIISSGVFGERISAWLSNVAATLPVLPN